MKNAKIYISKLLTMEDITMGSSILKDMGILIAVVDDESDILELVSIHLKKANYYVREFQDAEDFLKFLEGHIPNLIILDLMLPDANGLDICKHLKNESKFADVPVIMLTAKGEESDKVLGLELGADDYITKPFSPRELVARVRAVLRRKVRVETNQKMRIGNIMIIDLQKYNVTVEEKKVELTSTEFRILKLLTSKIGWVYTREQILDYLWGKEKAVIDRTIDVHIKNLREKLGKAGNLIKNIRGVGYKLEE